MYTRRFWVDTETTGLDSRKHFAFQISYLIEENNRLLLERTLEMRPDNYKQFEFDSEAEDVHGYSKEKILSLPSESEQFGVLLEDLQQYGENRLTITGYNVSFDIYFLRALFARETALQDTRNESSKQKAKKFYDYFDYMHCDVMQLVQAYRVAGKLDLPSIELEKVCRHFGISTEGAHNSMADIVNTKAVFDRLVDR
ncbi:putative exonuclease [Treponema primitia ZAS-2]|uniref:Putative exonuclease n=1 Tax=Treponema primitia (strain ATCC BAA-887 / DSM 12427 / ZAS-2) TaxID=545694 RepID=F5YP27_TREPZ|nr:exonuclease domain-containing protein [Treponema primitia]AEF85483.1 putative exonuclease [Treponema primitia ZAS-2]